MLPCSALGGAALRPDASRVGRRSTRASLARYTAHFETRLARLSDKARDAFLRTEEAKRAERVVARAFALAALRRGELASGAARAAAARAVLARHALRAAAGPRENLTAAGVGDEGLPPPFVERLDTPGRDAALACGRTDKSPWRYA